MKKQVFGILLRFAVLAAAVSVILLLSVKGYVFGKAVFDEREGTSKNPYTVTVTVETGEGIRQVAEKLKSEGLIDSPLVLIVQKYFYGSSLKAGSYRLNSNMTGKMILDVLSGAAVDTEEAS